jgi:hypothetical protein
MIDVMTMEREKIRSALIAENVDSDCALEMAEELIGSLLTEGIYVRPNGKSARPLLSLLSGKGFLQRLRAPFGVAYSVPAIRTFVLDIRIGEM